MDRVVGINERKTEGRYNNMVRLNTPIYEAQDTEINRICNVIGKSKADVIREAISLYINTLRKEGV